ncbi:O-acetyltransferase -1 [Hyphodiscus hymeniophilus]|uniref:O-acetyltransferase -1 n=1 Tax=Hyphodiscus hymeniophilus TaxID=353542 RepID=A0A9P7AU70_9HELO|nr:O-acetyltransferase -1 [Hyphodiscus hymeniophilus]
MAARDDNLLEKGYWESVKVDDSGNSAPKRAKQYWEGLSPSSILSRRWTGGPRKTLRPTAYLDGLRGFAALVVYFHHHQLWARDIILADVIFERGFGYDGEYYFAALPGVRTFFSGGHYAVTVFFVISGYVLSTKPLTLIDAGEYRKLSENVGSALFRRWWRLFIPVICTTLVYMASWHIFGLWISAAKMQPTFREELWNWYCEWKSFSYVFKEGGNPWLSYNLHVWSIPVEFRGSIIIYTSLLAFSRATRNARLWCEMGLIIYFMWIADGSHYAMFCAGMLLCDLDLLAEKNNLPSWFYRLEPFKELIFYHLFIISVYLGGVPSHNDQIEEIRKVRGWYYLSILKPQAVYDYKWFYLFWAAAFLVASIPRISWLKRFFEKPYNQYLGRISFALYLVHGPLLWVVGDRLYAAVGWAREAHHEHLPGWVDILPLSTAGPLGCDLAFWVVQLVLLPLTLWVAHVVTKLFDEPSVKFAQWLYGKTLAPPSVRS